VVLGFITANAVEPMFARRESNRTRKVIMDTTVTTTAQGASQYGDLLIAICVLGWVALLAVPVIRDYRKREKETLKRAKLRHIVPCTEQVRTRDYPDTAESDQLLFAEIRGILAMAKPLKEIRPNDVRQRLNAKGWGVSETRILRAMRDLIATDDGIGYRKTKSRSLAIWRIPEQSDEHSPATALSCED